MRLRKVVMGRMRLVQVALQERGWTTAGFVSAYPLHSKFGWDQGMDRYDDDFGNSSGSVYVFDYVFGSWFSQGKFNAPDAEASTSDDAAAPDSDSSWSTASANSSRT